MQRPTFVPFDERVATRIYQRNLPHWRQAGAAYFVTFRLGDALPAAAVRELDERRDAWLKARGVFDPKDARSQLSPRDRFLYRKYINRLGEEAADASHGACHLKQPAVASLVAGYFRKHDGDAYHLGDFVLMPNHVHVLLVPAAEELETTLKRLKGATAVACNRLLARQGPFWQPDSFDHIVRNLEQLSAYREYIAMNPVKARIQLCPAAAYRAQWMDEWFR
jgi:putative transposase